MLQAIRKRWILRGYRARLPGALRRDYGKADVYTPAQIRACIARHRFSDDYACYALALYTDHDSFRAYHTERGENCDFHTMRQEACGFGDMGAPSLLNAMHHFLRGPNATHHHTTDTSSHNDSAAHHVSGSGDFSSGSHGHP